MIFDINTVKERYNYYNNLYFDNELPHADNISFFLTKAKSYIAQVVFPKMFSIDKYPSMNLSTAYNFENEHSYDHTIVHEMIHIYQWLKKTECGHGRVFKLMSSLIYSKSSGKFNIKRCHYGAVERIKTSIIKQKIDEECFIVISSESQDFRVYKNSSLTEIYNQLRYYSFPREIYYYKGNIFNHLKSAKKGILRSISFHKRDDELINEMKKTAKKIQ